MSIWSRLRKLENNLKDFVTCEFCGCAVVKGHEVRGNHEIKFREPASPNPSSGLYGASIVGMINDAYRHLYDEPYIHTPVYCKRCAGEKAKPKRSHHKK